MCFLQAKIKFTQVSMVFSSLDSVYVTTMEFCPFDHMHLLLIEILEQGSGQKGVLVRPYLGWMIGLSPGSSLISGKSRLKTSEDCELPCTHKNKNISILMKHFKAVLI